MAKLAMFGLNNLKKLVSSKFLKTSFIYTVSGSLPMAASFVLLPFYTNHLNPNQYGLLAMLIGLSVLFQTFLTFSVDSVLYLYHHQIKNNPEALKRFYGSVNLLVLGAGLLSSLLFGLGGKWIFSYLLKEEGKDIFLLGICSIVTGFFAAYGRLYAHVLMLHERPWTHLGINFIGFLIVMIGSGVGMYLWKDSVWGPVFGRLLSFGTVFLFSFSKFSTEYFPSIDWDWFKKIIKQATPIFLYTGILTLMANADVFILNRYLPKDQVGIFDLSIKLAIAVDFILNALWNASLPQVTAALEQNKERKTSPLFNSYFNLLSLILILVSTVSIVFLPWIVKILITKPAYHEALHYLPLSIATFCFRVLNTYFLVTIFYFKKNYRLLYVYLILLGLKFLISPFLTSTSGVVGIFESIYLLKLIELALLYVMNYDLYEFKPNLNKIALLPLLLFVSCIILFYLSENDFFRGDLAVAGIILLFTMISFKNEWIIFRKKIHKH